MGLLRAALRLGVLWVLSLLVAIVGLEVARHLVLATEQCATDEIVAATDHSAAAACGSAGSVAPSVGR